jgi:hypothetical protein
MIAMGRLIVAGGLLVLGLAGLTTRMSAQVTVVLAGTSSGGISQALNSLGRNFTAAGTTMGPDPATYNLRAGDYIIISNDGGTDASFFNYTSFLNAGGHVILVGGSNYQPYRDWVAGYFNITDTANTWHTDGAWTTLVDNSLTSGLPSPYTFTGNSVTYHMLGFLSTPDTVLYGRNDENIAIAALRTYANGGTLNYMALDLGNAGYVTTADLNNFIVPWLRGSLAIPEPSTYALVGTGLAVLGLRAWRRRRAR